MKTALILVVAAAILAGCTAPTTTPSSTPGSQSVATQSTTGATSGSGGGVVAKVAPQVLRFAGSISTSVDNSGTYTEIFSGTVYDANDVVALSGGVLSVALTGAPPGTTYFNHTITASDVSPGKKTQPSTFGADNYEVWNGGRGTGTMYFEFRYTFPLGTPAGTDVFTPSVVDAVGTTASGSSVSTTVTVFSQITIAPSPVDSSGNALAGVAWGAWTAAPNATNVAGTNYLKLTNTGQKATASVVLAFSSQNFTSADGNYTIPIAGNVQFAWANTPSSTTTPAGLTFNYGATSASGSVTVTFQGLNNVIFVEYRIVQLPRVVAPETYSAAYTATEV
ncbi:MAG: hypothetical protein ACYDDF_13135 [Thermoplasmatota archaeon]